MFKFINEFFKNDDLDDDLDDEQDITPEMLYEKFNKDIYDGKHYRDFSGCVDYGNLKSFRLVNFLDDICEEYKKNKKLKITIKPEIKKHSGKTWYVAYINGYNICDDINYDMVEARVKRIAENLKLELNERIAGEVKASSMKEITFEV